MAKPLPFKLAKESPIIVEVGSPEMGVIELQKRGALEAGAEKEIANYMVKVGTESMSEAEIVVATIFLRYRLPDPDWSQSDTEAIEDFGLVHAIYEFVAGERNRWAPKPQLMKVEGTEAEAVAIAHAKEKHAIAATREDLAALNVWYVYRDRASVPTDHKLIHDFSDAIGVLLTDIASVASGKGKRPTGQPSSGGSNSTTPTKPALVSNDSPGA